MIDLTRCFSWSAAYYEGRPLVDDTTYDATLNVLKSLEARVPALQDLSSPTQQVGSPPVSSSVAHLFPMLSLDNITDMDRLTAFHTSVYKRAASWLSQHRDSKSIPFTIEHKYDGMAVSLIFRGGRLIRAVSRGDGTMGEDITGNVRRLVRNLPSTVNLDVLVSAAGLPADTGCL